MFVRCECSSERGRLVRFSIVSALSVALLFAPFLISGCAPKQYINHAYFFSLVPKEGEVLKDVTLYLPFPTHNGKPVMQIFKSLHSDFERFGRFEKNHPKTKKSLVKTEYGMMLKVHISRIDSRGIDFAGNFSYERWHSDKRIASRYQLEPSWNRARLGRGENQSGCKAKSRIYVSYKDAKEIAIGLQYRIQVKAPWLLPLDHVPENNYHAYIGWDESRTGVLTSVRFTSKQGWVVLPLKDLGFYEV